MSGLRLEPVVLSFYADPPAEATPGWYPTITHSWNFRRAADGSGTLNLTVYPFCYEAASDEGQFFDSFTFRITTATTTLRIDSITPNEVEVIQGTPLAADVLLTNTGVAQDVVVRATVGPGGGATAEHTVLSRVLRGLAGQASLSLEWGTSGVPAGSYALAVELRDTAGNLLEVSALDFAVLSGAARFVIGQASYSVGGVSHAMDVAPYINSSRTFLPVRFVGYACGVAEQDISWDQMTRTATLRKGGVQLNLQIGSRALRVVRDGVPTVITMDVAPELTAGRTMLPVRWVAEQLGYTVGWDEPSRAVTLTP